MQLMKRNYYRGLFQRLNSMNFWPVLNTDDVERVRAVERPRREALDARRGSHPQETLRKQRAANAIDELGERLLALDAAGFADVMAEVYPRETRSCSLFQPEGPRENALLAAMLELRWARRPSSAWLAREFGDLVRRRPGCGVHHTHHMGHHRPPPGS